MSDTRCPHQSGNANPGLCPQCATDVLNKHAESERICLSYIRRLRNAEAALDTAMADRDQKELELRLKSSRMACFVRLVHDERERNGLGDCEAALGKEAAEALYSLIDTC